MFCIIFELQFIFNMYERSFRICGFLRCYFMFDYSVWQDVDYIVLFLAHFQVRDVNIGTCNIVNIKKSINVVKLDVI